MNPIVKNGTKFKWKFEGIERLDEQGKYSDVFVSSGLAWKLRIKKCKSNNIEYLSIYLCFAGFNKQVIIAPITRANYICETTATFELWKQEDNQSKNSLKRGFGGPLCYTVRASEWGLVTFIEWSNLLSKGFVRDNSIWMDVDFDFKCFDFSKDLSNFSDSVVEVENVQFHTSKGLLCVYSKYFHEKFTKSNEEVISIDDVHYDEFAYVLAALSPDPIGITIKTYDILMDSSNKFEIESLTRKCLKYFTDNQCIQLVENVTKAEANKDKKLMQECIEKLKRGREAKLFVESEAFQSFENTTKIRFFNEFLKFW